MPQEIGLRSKYQDPSSSDTLPDDVLSALSRLEEWDLTAAKEGAVHTGYVSEREADEVAREFRRFMAIYLLAREGIVDRDPVGPSKKVDALWHAFLLDTEAYEAFCQQVMGGYVHHAAGEHKPDRPSGDGMRKLLGTYFEGADLKGIWAGQLAVCWPNDD